MRSSWVGVLSIVRSTFSGAVSWGCAPALTTGAPCAFNSECPSDLACLGGRCRIECQTSRDCPDPLACVAVGDALSACRVEEDEDGCTEEICPAPLACRAGVCVDPCTDASECVPENVCNDAVCEAPPAVLIGACSPVGPMSGCPMGEACARVGTTYGCTAAATGPLGTRCTTESQCGAGTSCVSGRCVQLCIPGMTSCGPGSLCRPFLDLLGTPTGASIGPAPPEGLGYCSEVCDALAPLPTDGCPDGTACSFTVGGSGRNYYCRTLEEPALDDYAPCPTSDVDPDLCAAGTICDVGPPASDPDRQCRPFCDPSSPTPCPGGRRCEPISGLPGTAFGTCVL